MATEALAGVITNLTEQNKALIKENEALKNEVQTLKAALMDKSTGNGSGSFKQTSKSFTGKAPTPKQTPSSQQDFRCPGDKGISIKNDLVRIFQTLAASIEGATLRSHKDRSTGESVFHPSKTIPSEIWNNFMSQAQSVINNFPQNSKDFSVDGRLFAWMVYSDANKLGGQNPIDHTNSSVKAPANEFRSPITVDTPSKENSGQFRRTIRFYYTKESHIDSWINKLKVTYSASVERDVEDGDITEITQ